MKVKLKNILIFLQALSFIPFFFGSLVFVFEFYDDYRILSNLNEYKPGFFIVTEKLDDSKGVAGGAISIDSIVIGNIDNKKARIAIGNIREYVKYVEIGDTVYVWYRNDRHITLVRKKEDTSFKVFRYIHDDFRGLMLFGIPPFIIIAFVRQRLQKRQKQNNTY